MQIKNPETRKHLEGVMAELASAYEEFSAARQQLETLESNANTLRRAAEAAEAQAEAHRATLRGILQETMGKPSKKLHEASADQRAAMVLAEEYRAMAEEVVPEIEEIKITASTRAKRVGGWRTKLLEEYSIALIAEALKEVGARLFLGLTLQQRCIDANRFDFRAAMQAITGDDLLPLTREMRRTMATHSSSLDCDADDSIIAAIQATDAAQVFNGFSPAHIHMIRAARGSGSES